MTSIWLWGTIGVTGTEVPKPEKQSQSIVSVSNQSRTIRKILLLNEIEQPSKDTSLLVQTPAPTNPAAGESAVIPITRVEAKATDNGVEVILQTTPGTQLQVVNRSTGNNFIADIIGGQLRSPDGNAFTFRSSKPVAGITEVVVTNIDANTVRITKKRVKTLIYYQQDRFRAALNFTNLFDVGYFESDRGSFQIVLGEPFTV
ncbi:AMIN domain-containing protein [Nostoc sp.]|uniref:AMIN domain-containing protein n=1 Tax=Nostoc sp. TaxID=1180 RepID=UPI003FA56177